MGRADLARLIRLADEGALQALAANLGYRHKATKFRTAETEDVAAEAPPPQPRATGAPEDWAPVPLWQPVEATFHDAEGATDEQETVPGDPSVFDAKPIVRRRASPVVPWPRLWRALDDASRTPVPRREIDADQLIRDWSRGRSVRRLPRRQGLAHARLVVMVDPAERLMPYWQDQIDVVRRLSDRLGPRSMRFVSAPRGGPWRTPVLADDEKLLALSDLGCLGSDSPRAALGRSSARWRRLGHRLRRNGAHERLVALVPGAGRLRGGDLRLWRVIDWERPGQAVRPSTEADERGAGEALRRLLRLGSIAMRLERGLVRDLRRLVPGTRLATESDLWRHADVEDRFAIGLVIEPKAARTHRMRLLEDPDPLVDEAVRTIRRWHEGLPTEILASEVVGWAAGGLGAGALHPHDVREARRFVAALADRMEGKGVESGGDEQVLTDAWFGRFESWAPADAWSDARFEKDLARARHAALARDPSRSPPAGASRELAAGGDVDPDLPVRRWTVRQTGAGLELQPWNEGYGGRVVEIEARRPRILVEDGIGPVARLDEQDPAWRGPLAAGVSLVTDVARVRLEPFATEPDSPRWAVASGRDEYGLWATFAVEGVEQRMRWIPPGRAWLGSPEDEEGRADWDHQPELYEQPHGFWLADTPCTQALWTAVMDGNPSEFKDEHRPVDSVSWEECEDFLGKLVHEEAELFPKLPTEFEWEYACRAGTRAATWMGDLEIRGANDAPVLDEIAWYGGNSGHHGFDLEKGSDSSGWIEKQYAHESAGTRTVGTRKPNPWGLYDMLGNVFEWTSTKWSTSDDDESAKRVFRGGSWFSVARVVRAAFRHWFHPGFRYVYLGFRLSLGREPGAEPEEESRGPVPEGVAERGTSRRGPGRDSGGGEGEEQR